ncbi:MAG: MarC family protein [Bergeyella zoohelcum]|nr:MarC family protein [Bergeyella zoohelcum]
MALFLLTFASLFSVLNPIGNLPVFLGLTQHDSKESKNKTALWSAINVFIILTVSFFIGEYILDFMGITIDVLRIAGGFLICMAGFSLLSGEMNKEKKDDELAENDKSNIAMTPLAIPLMAGPGSMSLLISMYDEYPNFVDKGIIITAVLGVAISIFLIFRSGNYITKFLGKSGMLTLSKIIGFLVLAIGIQYVVNSLLIIFKI